MEPDASSTGRSTPASNPATPGPPLGSQVPGPPPPSHQGLLPPHPGYSGPPHHYSPYPRYPTYNPYGHPYPPPHPPPPGSQADGGPPPPPGAPPPGSQPPGSGPPPPPGTGYYHPHYPPHPSQMMGPPPTSHGQYPPPPPPHPSQSQTPSKPPIYYPPPPGSHPPPPRGYGPPITPQSPQSVSGSSTPTSASGPGVPPRPGPPGSAQHPAYGPAGYPSYYGQHPAPPPPQSALQRKHIMPGYPPYAGYPPQHPGYPHPFPPEQYGHPPPPSPSQSQQVSISVAPPPQMSNLPNPLAPPAIMDEASQASTVSSQAGEENGSGSGLGPDFPTPGGTPKSKNHHTFPSGASNLSSPGASSYADDFEASSPSWPRTPASPAVNQNFRGANRSTGKVRQKNKFETILRLYDISDDPERRLFLNRLLQLQEDRGTPITQVPTISKVPLDLYQIYVLVKERGGYQRVSDLKLWKEICEVIDVAKFQNGAYALRKQYMKHVLPYENQYDRGGVHLPSNPDSENSNPPSVGGGPLNGVQPPSAMPSPGAVSPAPKKKKTPKNKSRSPHMSPSADSSGPTEAEFYAQQAISGQVNAQGSMLPPSSVPPPGASGQHLPGHGVTGDSVSVKDPFADEEQQRNYSASGRYPPQGPYGSASYGEGYNRPEGGYPPYQRAPGQPYPGGPQQQQQAQAAAAAAAAAAAQQQQQQQQQNSAKPPFYNGQQQYPQQYRFPPPTSGAPPTGGTFVRAPHYAGQPQAQPHEQPPHPPYSANENKDAKMKSPLAQRLLAAKSETFPETYPPGQYPQQAQGGTGPAKPGQYPGHTPNGNSPMTGPPTTPNTPSSWNGQPAPPPPTSQPSRYGQQKRHPDFSKTPENQPGQPQQYPYPPGSAAFSARGPQPSHPPGQAPGGLASAQSQWPGPGSAPQSGPQFRPPFSGFPHPTAPHSGTGGSAATNDWDEARTAQANAADQHQYSNRRPYQPPSAQAAASAAAAAAAQAQQQANNSQMGPPPAGVTPVPAPGNGVVVQPTVNGPTTQHPKAPFPRPESNVNFFIRQGQMIPGQAPPPGPPPNAQIRPQIINQQVPPSIMAIHCSTRREAIFPPGSLEATASPILTKRRRMTVREQGTFDTFQICMALQSGTLTHTNWAYRLLLIVSCDDSGHQCLEHRRIPLLLELLLEHLKAHLNAVLKDLCTDTEPVPDDFKSIFPHIPDEDEDDFDIVDESNMDQFFKKRYSITNEKEVMLDGESKDVTPQGIPIKIVKAHPPALLLEQKTPEPKEEIQWKKGHGASTDYVCTFMNSQIHKQPYHKLMEKQEKPTVLTNGDQKPETEKAENVYMSEAEKRIRDLMNDPSFYPKIHPDHCERFIERISNENKHEDDADDCEESTFASLGEFLPGNANDEISREHLRSRLLTLSTILCNFSFINGIDNILANHPGILLILSRLLLIKHKHYTKSRKSILSFHQINDEPATQNCEKEPENMESFDDILEDHWWRDVMNAIRTNTLLTFSNLSCQLDLSKAENEVAFNIIDGSVHWALCDSVWAHTPISGGNSITTPRRLALEILAKMSIVSANVDLFFATVSGYKVKSLLQQLVRYLNRSEEEAIRELAIVLLDKLAHSEYSIWGQAPEICKPVVSNLLSYLEQIESVSMNLAASQGVNIFRENPEILGTTLDVLRKTTSILLNIYFSAPKVFTLIVQQRIQNMIFAQFLDPQAKESLLSIVFEIDKRGNNKKSARTVEC